jgi:hypothetical protein|tara:strand:+ start:349 stop:525 length:177 start_codon:yes stop_codon:yes gene_type:complete
LSAKRRENRTKIDRRREESEKGATKSIHRCATNARAYIYARVEKRGEEERKHTCKKGT